MTPINPLIVGKLTIQLQALFVVYYSIPLTPQDEVTPIDIIKQDAHKDIEYSDGIAGIVNEQRQECLLMLKVMNNMYHYDMYTITHTIMSFVTCVVKLYNNL